MKIRLKDKLSNNFYKMVIVPLFIVGLFIAILFTIFRMYMFEQMEFEEVTKAKNILETIFEDEKKVFEYKFSEIKSFADILQKEHQQLFQNKNTIDKKIDYAVAKNGVFYKTTKDGSSLYYSSKTTIGKKEREKISFTENMDTAFKIITNIHPIIVATYFNSYDGMNRLYPYINEVYTQYGSSLVMQDYNFYYLADEKHNPKRESVWTKAYLDPAGQGWMISCVTPIYNGDFLEGVSGIDITIEKIIDDILNKKLPFDAKMVLINKDGKVTAMPKEIAQLSNIKELTKHTYTERIKNTINKPKEFNIHKSDNKLFKNISQMIKNDIEIKEININGDDYIVLKRIVEATESILVLVVKKSKIFETVECIKDKSLKGVLVLLLIFTLILYFRYKSALKEYQKLSKNIVEPIISLAKISSDISKHNKILVPKTDILEIDELSDNLIEMLEELHLKTTKLEKFNKTLTLKIEDATKELKEKNKNMQILLDTTIEAVAIFDENYNLVQINGTTLDIFGFESFEDMVGMNLLDFIPKDEQVKANKALSKDSTASRETKLYKKDKSIFPALVKGSYIQINNKRHRISTIIDLTEIKEKEQQLLQQSKLAQMGDMMSMIAHQWRQPLNAISASSINLSLMSSMGMLEDEKLQESSKFIQDQTQKMSQTIDTFMNFVKPAKESKEFTLSHTVEAIIHIMGIQLANHNIKVNIVSKDDDISLIGFEDLLEQVIINLLSNARDAFEELDIENKKIDITIDTKNSIPIIIIEDNAGGIPKEIQNKIFNPYFTTKEQGKGTGIGLYMSMDIMKKSFGGDLVYSAVEGGSRFELVCGEKG